jgi:hypothetical protein
MDEIEERIALINLIKACLTEGHKPHERKSACLICDELGIIRNVFPELFQ